MKKTKMPKETLKNKKSVMLRGSVTLLASVIIFSITATGMIASKGAKKRQTELELHRLLDLQGEQLLSLYDRNLLERYGIWAFDPLKIDLKFNTKEILSIPGVNYYHMKPHGYYGEGKNFYTQAVHFAKGRLPLRAADELYERIKAFQEAGKVVSGVPVAAAIEKMSSFLPKLSRGIDLPAIESGVSERQGGSKAPPAASGGAAPVSRKAEPDKEQDKDKDKAGQKENALTKEEEDALRLFRGEVKAFDAETGSAFQTEEDKKTGLLASVLTGLSRGIDALTFELPESLNKLIFQEYVLSQFSSQVRGPDAKTDEGKHFRTLSGQFMSDIKVMQPFEAERILTGFENPHAARAAVSALILSTRLVLNFAAEINDDYRMARHRAKASALSAIIAAATLGEVQLDPEPLSYILALLASGKNAYGDRLKLNKGETAALYPAEGHTLSKVHIYYTDYLRLISLFLPAEELAARAGHYVYLNTELYGMTGADFRASLRAWKDGFIYERKVQYEILADGK